MEWKVMVADWIARSGLSAAEIARRAGVSGSTIHRIRNGQTDPSLGTLREIALACGRDVDLRTSTVSDPWAATAARLVLEGRKSSVDPRASVWIARLERQASSPLGILAAAAAAANPFARAGSIHFAGDATTGMLASAGSVTGGSWALSGTPGLDPPGRQELFAGHALLWVEDVGRAEALLRESLRSVPNAAIASVTIAQADAGLFEGSFDVDSLVYAAPIQIILDCLALGGDAAMLADRIVSEW